MTSDGPASQSFHFATRVGPRWSNIDRMRTAVLHGAEAVFGPGDISEVVSTITSELMENAVKYGDWRPPDRLWLKVTVIGGGRSLQIDVECPTDEGSTHLTNLHRMLSWIDTFPTPRDAYYERVREIAESGDRETSGMGLVRMAAEGPCRLSASLLDGGMLRVSAVVDIAPDALSDSPE
jgi:hypothetical protein